MSIGKTAGSLLVAGAVVLAACGDVVENAEAEPATAEAGAIPATTAAAPTTQPGTSETGEALMSDTLDPQGSVAGGNVGLSYPGDTYPAELAGIIGLAVSDLADRLGVDESSIVVVSVEEVTWSDASLGCPQPDMSYAQVITDGLRIVLESSGAVYDYRSGGMSDPVLCEQKLEKGETGAGTFELTDEGDIVFVPATEKAVGVPTEDNNPPDE